MLWSGGLEHADGDIVIIVCGKVVLGGCLVVE